MRDSSMLLSLAVLAVAVGINLFGPGKVVADRVTEAVMLYLLIGLTWADAYIILQAHSPGAFTIRTARNRSWNTGPISDSSR